MLCFIVHSSAFRWDDLESVEVSSDILPMYRSDAWTSANNL